MADAPRTGVPPRIRLGHYMGRQGRVHSWALWPITVPRPAEGERSGGVTCGTCGEVLTYRVLSVDGRRRARRLFTALGLAFLLVVAFGVVTVVRFADLAADEIPDTTFWGAMIAVFGGGLAAILSFSAAWSEDGVRGPGRWFRQGRHALHYPPV